MAGNSIDLDSATITETGDMLRRREVSPVELTRATIERIERLQPILFSFITPTPEYALLRASEAEKEIMQGRYRGPFHGIPYTLKDWVDAKGVPTTYVGPRGPAQHYMPTESSTIHALLEEAGGILMGKVDPGIGIERDTGGPVGCRNAWDPTRSPGTSSAGSGSATAASMGLGSIGADTGGSVRHPASNSSLVGMRPTQSRISGFGVKASPLTTDQAGPLTKTVEDNAIMMDILGVYDPKDPASINEPRYDHGAWLRDGVKGVRIGVPVDDWVWKDWLSEEEEQVVRRAIGVLEELGASIIEVQMPLAGESRALMQAVGGGGALYYLEHFNEEQMAAWPEVRGNLEASLQRPLKDHFQAVLKLTHLRQEVNAVLKEVDVIAMPTGSTYGDAWDAETATIRGRTVPARSRAVWRNGMASVCGHPAMSVPCGFGNNDKWPIGLMLHGQRLQEALLYRVAYAYEQATEWHTRHPNI